MLFVVVNYNKIAAWMLAVGMRQTQTLEYVPCSVKHKGYLNYYGEKLYREGPSLVSNN